MRVEYVDVLNMETRKIVLENIVAFLGKIDCIYAVGSNKAPMILV